MTSLDEQGLEQSRPSYRNLALTHGGVAGAALIVLGLIMYVAGFSDPAQQNSPIAWINQLLTYGIMVAGMVLAVKKHRDTDLGGFITFGRAFGVAYLVIVAIAVITVLWTMLFFNLIAPDFLEQIREASINSMIDNQGMSAEQAEAAMDNPFAKSFMNPTAFALIAGVTTLFLGLLLALIVAGIMRKTDPRAAI